MVTRVLYFLVHLLETLFALRFFLKLFSANPEQRFVRIVYRITEPFVKPFQEIFEYYAPGGYVIEWATLIAAVVYIVIGYASIRVLQLLFVK
jgi:YggT family protein